MRGSISLVCNLGEISDFDMLLRNTRQSVASCDDKNAMIFVKCTLLWSWNRKLRCHRRDISLHFFRLSSELSLLPSDFPVRSSRVSEVSVFTSWRRAGLLTISVCERCVVIAGYIVYSRNRCLLTRDTSWQCDDFDRRRCGRGSPKEFFQCATKTMWDKRRTLGVVII